MPKQKITPKAKYPVQTQKFIQDVSKALKDFEENIRFPGEEIRASAYRVLLEAYCTALTSIWSQAQFANTEQILKTALGKLEIIKYTKHHILPNPDSSELAQEEENSVTRVLAAAIYLKIENMFFNETSSRVEIATAFKCNISQLTKAVTGVHYKGGPHRYKPKQKTGHKRSSTDQSQQATKKPKTKGAHASTSKASTSSSEEKKPSQVVAEDTLSSESGSSFELPLGLLQ